jgi:hypothetical protein
MSSGFQVDMASEEDGHNLAKPPEKCKDSMSRFIDISVWPFVFDPQRLVLSCSLVRHTRICGQAILSQQKDLQCETLRLPGFYASFQK